MLFCNNLLNYIITYTRNIHILLIYNVENSFRILASLNCNNLSVNISNIKRSNRSMVRNCTMCYIVPVYAELNNGGQCEQFFQYTN